MNFSTIAAPMIEVVKGTAFKCMPKAQTAFEEIKDRLTRTPLLALLCFEKVFEVERETSSVGVGGILVQEGRPLAFFNEKLCESKRKYFTYDKKFYAIVCFLEHWSRY